MVTSWTLLRGCQGPVAIWTGQVPVIRGTCSVYDALVAVGTLLVGKWIPVIISSWTSLLVRSGTRLGRWKPRATGTSLQRKGPVSRWARKTTVNPGSIATVRGPTAPDAAGGWGRSTPAGGQGLAATGTVVKPTVAGGGSPLSAGVGGRGSGESWVKWRDSGAGGAGGSPTGGSYV